MDKLGVVYLIPSLLHEEGVKCLPAYLLEAANKCEIFFVENERTARRYLKMLDRTFNIDAHQWHIMDQSPKTNSVFKDAIIANKNIGIISEAGCPGIADPGQALVLIAQQLGATIKPLVGPSSILLALMASGMNGQQFRFLGYLPIDNGQRIKMLKELESESAKLNCTQIFIETPYRNNQLLEAILKACKGQSKCCIAADLTSEKEWIRTQSVADWQKQVPNLHKRPVIFLLYSGN